MILHERKRCYRYLPSENVAFSFARISNKIFHCNVSLFFENYLKKDKKMYKYFIRYNFISTRLIFFIFTEIVTAKSLSLVSHGTANERCCKSLRYQLFSELSPNNRVYPMQVRCIRITCWAYSVLLRSHLYCTFVSF